MKKPSFAPRDPENMCPYGPQNHPLPEKEVKVDMGLHERKEAFSDLDGMSNPGGRDYSC